MPAHLPEDRSRLGWWLVAVALGLFLAFVVYSFIGTFVFGIFVYYATRPVYTRVKRRIHQPSLSAALSLLVVAIPALLLLTYTIAIGIQEITRLSQRFDLNSLGVLFGPYVDISRIPHAPEELLADGGLDSIGEVLTSAASYVGFIGTGALHLFVMIALAFYLLRDGYRLSRWTRRRFADDAGVLEAYFTAVDRSYHQVFFGNILNAILTGVIGAISYNILSLIAPSMVPIPYPTLLGLLAGAASLIPIVGMKLVYFPVMVYLGGYALLIGEPQFLWIAAVFGVVSFVIVDTIPDLVLRPYVSGRNLHVGLVMFAYIFGPLLFGWYGIFLGPMLLVLVIHFARIVLPELMAGVPIQPVAVDPTHLTEPPAESIEQTDSDNARRSVGESPE